MVKNLKKTLFNVLFYVQLASGVTFATTPDHPFYINGKYVDAEKLTLQDSVTAFDGNKYAIAKLWKKDTSVTVYNFEVADNHNYYIGKEHVLVHNNDERCILGEMRALAANGKPGLRNAYLKLDVAKRRKFLEDFRNADPEVLEIFTKPNSSSFEAWNKLSDLTGDTKTWIAKNPDLLKHIDSKNLTPTQIDNLKNYYSSHQMPRTCATRPRCTFQGDGFTVEFDDFGHPRFESFVPEISGVGKISYNPDVISSSGGNLPVGNNPTLRGTGDIADANNWAKKKYPDDKFKALDNNRCKIYDTSSPFADSNGWVECTWHHHEDGKNLIPVPSNVHNRVDGGAGHTGGNSIIDKGCKDIFPSLSF